MGESRQRSHRARNVRRPFRLQTLNACGQHAANSIVPISAHAAFDKGAAYLGFRVRTIDVDPVNRQVDLKRVARAM